MMFSRRRSRARLTLRADVINTPASVPAVRARSAEWLFFLMRDSGRVLGAFCGGLVIGCYLAGHDLTIPALGGAAFGLNELVYHLAESLGSRRLRADPARPSSQDRESSCVLAPVS